MEIGSITHQPSGVSVNPNLVTIFETFFERVYAAVTADKERGTLDLGKIQAVEKGKAVLREHNFLFRSRT